MSETNYDDIPCTCGVGNVFHAPFHHAWCPCHTQGSQPPPSEVERLRAENAALAQQLADVAYLEAWMRDMRGRPHWDEHSRRFFADGHPEDGAEDLPALGALLRQREEGR